MTKPILSFILIIISFAFAFLYVKPEFDVAKGYRADIATLDQTLQKAETIKKIISDTAENLKSISEESLARSAVLLPEEIDDLRLANNIQNMGFSNGLVLESIKVSRVKDDAGVASAAVSAKNAPPVGVSKIRSGDRAATSGKINTTESTTLDKKYKITKVNFLLTSPYDTFFFFLDDLEKSLGLMNINSLSFIPIKEATVRTKKGNNPILYRYTVDLETYSLQ